MSDPGDSSSGPVEEPQVGHGEDSSDTAVIGRMKENVVADSYDGWSSSSGVSVMGSDRSMHHPPLFAEECRSTSYDGWSSSSGVSVMGSERSMQHPPLFAKECTSDSIEESKGALCSGCPEKAFKSCITCLASYCKEHVKLHFSAPALQKHQLVEPTENLQKKEYGSTSWTNSHCVKFPFQQLHFLKEKLAVEEHLIKTGSINCYKLPTQKSNMGEDGNIRRRTFGSKDTNSMMKTILLVGETGAGKTTLLNTMVNYMLEVEPEDGFWFEITEDNKKSQTESQTAVVTVYEIFVKTSSLSLRIIDTPGYGNTAGIDFDSEIAESLLSLFRSEDGVHEITVVGLVVKVGQNRPTDHQTCVLSAIMSLFGQDIGRSIVPLITHSDGMSVDNTIASLNEAEVPYAKDETENPVYFMFNNRQSEAYKKGCEALHLSAWNLGYQNMHLFLKFPHSWKETNVRITADVKGLEALVSKLQDDIEMEEGKQNELRQTQKALEENRTKLENNENFTFSVEETFMDKAPINLPWYELTKKAMCCTMCKQNCHYPGCWWVKDISRCRVMKDGRCTVCRGKCPVSVHVKEKWYYKPKKRLVQKNTADLRKQYGKQENIAKSLEKEINESKVQMKDLLEEAYDCILKLEDIALKKDSMCLLIHLDFLIEKMMEMGDEEKVKKLEEIQKRNSDAQVKTGTHAFTKTFKK